MKTKDGFSAMYVVTAAHVLVKYYVMEDHFRFATDVRFYWKREGGKFLTELKIDKFRVYPRYLVDARDGTRGLGYDYAIGRIEDQSKVEDKLEEMKLDPMDSIYWDDSPKISRLFGTGASLRVSGYGTGDSHMRTMAGTLGTLFFDRKEKKEEHGVIVYDKIDTFDGQSGAPVYAIPTFEENILEESQKMFKVGEAELSHVRVGVHVGAMYGDYGDDFLNYGTLETEKILIWSKGVLEEWGIM